METIPAAQAVEALIHAYGTLVFQTIYGFTGDWHESQDLTQETFLQALRAIDAARASSGAHFHAKAWLFRIAMPSAGRWACCLSPCASASSCRSWVASPHLRWPGCSICVRQPCVNGWHEPENGFVRCIARRAARPSTVTDQLGSLQRAQSLLHRGSRWSRTKSWCRPGCPVWSSPALDLHSGGARQMVLRLSQCGTTHNKTTEH